MTKEKTKKSKFVFNDSIRGNFVICGKPVIEEEYKIIDWIGSFVRITEIKTIHSKLNKYIPVNENKCIFYTYKDEWYIVDMPEYELVENINHYLSKGNSHGSEIPRDNIR